jgi:hypothetical protein
LRFNGLKLVLGAIADLGLQYAAQVILDVSTLTV